jgi:hypothetical protein
MRHLERRIAQLERANPRREVEPDPRRIQHLVLQNWNPGFGEATPERVRNWVAVHCQGFRDEIAKGSTPELAMRSTEAMIIVIGERPIEDLRRWAAEARRARDKPSVR